MLQPQQLLLDLRAGRLHDAERHRLADCTQCGRCDSVCPSDIPLLARLVEAKTRIAANLRARQVAAAARDRFNRRQQRLQREADERSQREASLSHQAASTDAVAAAIARAKARRLQPRGNP